MQVIRVIVLLFPLLVFAEDALVRGRLKEWLLAHPVQTDNSSILVRASDGYGYPFRYGNKIYYSLYAKNLETNKIEDLISEELAKKLTIEKQVHGLSRQMKIFDSKESTPANIVYAGHFPISVDDVIIIVTPVENFKGTVIKMDQELVGNRRFIHFGRRVNLDGYLGCPAIHAATGTLVGTVVFTGMGIGATMTAAFEPIDFWNEDVQKEIQTGGLYKDIQMKK